MFSPPPLNFFGFFPVLDWGSGHCGKRFWYKQKALYPHTCDLYPGTYVIFSTLDWCLPRPFLTLLVHYHLVRLEMRSSFVFESRVLAPSDFLRILLQKWVILSFNLIFLFSYSVLYSWKKPVGTFNFLPKNISLSKFKVCSLWKTCCSHYLRWLYCQTFPALHEASSFLQYPITLSSLFLRFLSIVSLRSFQLSLILSSWPLKITPKPMPHV